MTSLTDFASNLKRYQSILITAHENPDPDSIGSMLALYFGLGQLGKTCYLISSDAVPDNLSWPGIESIKCHDQLKSIPHFEAAVVLDCDPERTGEVAGVIEQASVVFNIDHHQGNPGKGDFNYIDPEEPATATMVYKVLQAMAVKIDPAIAQAVYGGVVGDTGGFRYANTSAEVLEICAELVRNGANPAVTAREIFETKSWEFMQILGFALTKLQRSAEGRVVWLALSCEDFKRYRVDPTQFDGLVQYARMVEGCEIAILFREVAPNEIRIGFRSQQTDVGSLARSLGGGGHRLASGCKLTGSLSDVCQTVVDEAIATLRQEV